MNFDTQEDEMEMSDEEIGFHEDEDELSVSEETDSTCGVPLCLKKVWDSPEIKKFIDAEDGKENWTCFHCNGTWSKWNHRNIIQHLLGGHDIQKQGQKSRTNGL